MRVHLVRVDDVFEQLARVHSAKLDCEAVLRDVRDVLQVVDVELNTAAALFNCFKQLHQFRPHDQLAQQDLHVLVDDLQRSHHLAGYALVRELEARVKLPHLLQLDECRLLLQEEHCTTLVV